jgi:hypothetical protein
MSLIQSSLEFVERFKNTTYLAFVEIEKKRIEGILHADENVLRNMDIIRRSGNKV